MIITDEQVVKLESFINEGFLTKSYALEGRKKYLKQVQIWLGTTYDNNKEDIPDWVYTLLTKKVEVGNSTPPEVCSDFIDKQIACCLQLLQDMRTLYYTQKQLKESHKQTMRMIWANWISFAAFIAAISIPFIVKCCSH